MFSFLQYLLSDVLFFILHITNSGSFHGRSPRRKKA